MPDIPGVVAVEHAGGYRLRLHFTDGCVKVADLTPYLKGPVFEPLKDVEYFKTAAVDPEFRCVVWPNGADAAPDALYKIGVDVSDVA